MARCEDPAGIAALYCRLSKEDAEKTNAGDDSESIQNQKLLLTDYAQRQGFVVYKTYSDDDYGGFSGRPNFNQMLKDAESGFFNVIICKHQSRFTRDMEMVERYIHGYFNQWGIRFISLTDNVDTAVKGSKKSRQINGLINEWYCEDLSENVRAVIKAKREQGQFVGAYVSYGYLKDRKDKHKLVIDNEAAQVVKRIFGMYLSGQGVKAIAAELTQMGIPTPSQHKQTLGINYKSANTRFSLERGVWSANTVRRILRNETYIGNMVQGRERSSSYKTKKLVAVPKSEWTVVEGTHEPIIDRKAFETVQVLINNKRTLFYNTRTPNLLAGKVICADCGSTLQRSGASRDGSERFLRCSLSQKTRDCTSHYISQNKLQAIVADKIRELIDSMLTPDNYIEIAEYIISGMGKSELELKAKQLNDTEAGLKRLKRDTVTAYSDRLRGIITEDDFVGIKQIFDEDKRALLIRKENLIREIAEYRKVIADRGSVESIIKNYNINPLTHEIINDFIGTIQVREKNPETMEQEIIINWNF